MALILNGTGVVTGLASINDGIITSDDIASGAITAAKIASGAITASNVPVGSILQVVQSTKTDTAAITSTSYVDVTGLSLSITPSSASNRILIIYSVNAGIAGDIMHGYGTLVRNSTEIFKADTGGSRRSATFVVNTDTQRQYTYSGSYIDSPATTSATTYKIQFLSSNGNSLYINRSARDNDALAYDGRSVSSITAMEIKG